MIYNKYLYFTVYPVIFAISFFAFFSWLLLHRKNIQYAEIMSEIVCYIRKFLKSPKTTDPNKKKLHIFPIFTNIVTHQYMVQSNQFNAKFYMYTTWLCILKQKMFIDVIINITPKTDMIQTFKIWAEKFNFCLFLYNKALYRFKGDYNSVKMVRTIQLH